MSSIIFNRLATHIDQSDACNSEQEVEDEQPANCDNEFDSPNYEIHLYKNIKNCNQLLNAMITGRRMDYVVIKMKKNQEFSIGVKHYTETRVRETNTLWCEDRYLISFIENEEMPPILTDIIDESWKPKPKEDFEEPSEENPGYSKEEEWSPFSNIYYNGCVLAEIRNYRQSSINSEYYSSYFILLKPSSFNYYYDTKKVVDLTKKGFKWSSASLLELESSVIYINSPKLCLDLNPNICLLAKKLTQKRNIFCDNSFIRIQRKKLKKSITTGHSKEFKLLNYIKANPYSKAFPRRIPTNSVNDHELFNSYAYKDIHNLAQDLTSNQNKSDELIKDEEHTLEHLDSHKCARLVIFWKPFDDSFYGTLLNDKHTQCKTPPDFHLGDRQTKDNYVKQFIEQYTEHENKLMRIIQRIGDEPPKERLTFAAVNLKMKQIQRRYSGQHGGNTNSHAINTLQKKSDPQRILRADDKSELAHLIERKPICSTLQQSSKATTGRNMMIDPMQSNVIRVSNISTPNAVRYIRPTSTITLNASRIATSTSASNDHTYQMETYLPEETTESNISVTYLPSNVYMSGSTVYTVRPSTTSKETSNETPLNRNQQQYSNSSDNAFM